jgi:hypothetical protein
MEMRMAQRTDLDGVLGFFFAVPIGVALWLPALRACGVL